MVISERGSLCTRLCPLCRQTLKCCTDVAMLRMLQHLSLHNRRTQTKSGSQPECWAARNPLPALTAYGDEVQAHATVQAEPHEVAGEPVCCKFKICLILILIYLLVPMPVVPSPNPRTSTTTAHEPALFTRLCHTKPARSITP